MLPGVTGCSISSNGDEQHVGCCWKKMEIILKKKTTVQAIQTINAEIPQEVFIILAKFFFFFKVMATCLDPYKSLSELLKNLMKTCSG